jgi:hypothetical protein
MGAPDDTSIREAVGASIRRVYESGGNFEIAIERGVATCRVWSRPDLSREDGARLALRNVEAFQRLAGEAVTSVGAVVLDLRQAPSSWGSVTQSCLERMMAIMETAHRAIAVVCENELQREQMRRIQKTHAKSQGMLFDSLDDAEAWALGRRPGPLQAAAAPKIDRGGYR